MLRYYKQIFTQQEKVEITYEQALETVLASYKDNDVVRDWLTIPNYIPCEFSNVYIMEEKSNGEVLMLMPGLMCMSPMDVDYDEDCMRN